MLNSSSISSGKNEAFRNAWLTRLAELCESAATLETIQIRTAPLRIKQYAGCTVTNLISILNTKRSK